MYIALNLTQYSHRGIRRIRNTFIIMIKMAPRHQAKPDPVQSIPGSWMTQRSQIYALGIYRSTQDVLKSGVDRDWAHPFDILNTGSFYAPVDLQSDTFVK